MKQFFNKSFEIIANRMLDSQLTFEKSNINHASMISNLNTRDLMKKSFTFNNEIIENSDRKKTVQEKIRLLNKTTEKTISHQFKINERETWSFFNKLFEIIANRMLNSQEKTSLSSKTIEKIILEETQLSNKTTEKIIFEETRLSSKIIEKTIFVATSSKKKIIKSETRSSSKTLMKFDTFHYRIYDSIIMSLSLLISNLFVKYNNYDHYLLYANSNVAKIHDVSNNDLKVNDLVISRMIVEIKTSMLNNDWSIDFDIKDMIRVTRVFFDYVAKIWMISNDEDVDDNVIENDDDDWYYVWYDFIHILCEQKKFKAEIFKVRFNFEQLRENLDWKCHGISRYVASVDRLHKSVAYSFSSWGSWRDHEFIILSIRFHCS